MSYGVLPSGFSRKPLAVILAEIEAQLITEFGPEVVQTPQSPLGALNGIFASIVAELWETFEDVYQSYDVTQAEGTRLDILGRLRLINRGALQEESQYRQIITNDGVAKITLSDMQRALASLPNVRFAQPFVNDSNEIDEYGLAANTVTAAVLGGDDQDIARVIDDHAVPGSTLTGNVSVETNFDGRCRTLKFIRPVEVPTQLEIFVKMNPTRGGCPAPSTTAVADALLRYLTSPTTRPWNGQNIDTFLIRQFIESTFTNVMWVGTRGIKGDDPWEHIDTIPFGLYEIADVRSVAVFVTEDKNGLS